MDGPPRRPRPPGSILSTRPRAGSPVARSRPSGRGEGACAGRRRRGPRARPGSARRSGDHPQPTSEAWSSPRRRQGAVRVPEAQGGRHREASSLYGSRLRALLPSGLTCGSCFFPPPGSGAFSVAPSSFPKPFARPPPEPLAAHIKAAPDRRALARTFFPASCARPSPRPYSRSAGTELRARRAAEAQVNQNQHVWD